MSKTIIEYDAELIERISLDAGEADTSCAPSLGEITANWGRLEANWGRLEYALYLILEAIDPRNVAKWTRIFLNAWTTKARRGAVRDVAIAEVEDERLREQLDKVLARFDALCLERNQLAHSVWRRIEVGRYELVPLASHQRKIVTSVELSKVAQEIDYLRQNLASLAMEFMAYRELRRINEKRRAAVHANTKKGQN